MMMMVMMSDVDDDVVYDYGDDDDADEIIDTVNGRNPAPVDSLFISLPFWFQHCFNMLQPFSVVQDLFHSQFLMWIYYDILVCPKSQQKHSF